MAKFDYRNWIANNKFILGKVKSKNFEGSRSLMNEERITNNFTASRYYEPKVGDVITYNIASNKPTKLKGDVKHDKGLGFFVINKGEKLEVKKLMNIKVTKVA